MPKRIDYFRSADQGNDYVVATKERFIYLTVDDAEIIFGFLPAAGEVHRFWITPYTGKPEGWSSHLLGTRY